MTGRLPNNLIQQWFRDVCEDVRTFFDLEEGLETIAEAMCFIVERMSRIGIAVKVSLMYCPTPGPTDWTIALPTSRSIRIVVDRA